MPMIASLSQMVQKPKSWKKKDWVDNRSKANVREEEFNVGLSDEES